MALKTKKKIKLYSSVVFAVLMLFACALCAINGGYVTYAWFTSKRTAQVDYKTLVADSLDTVSAVKAYPYHKITDASDPNYGSSGVYTYDLTSVTSGAFGKHSLLSLTGNSLLLEIDLTSYATKCAALTLLAHSSATSYLGELNSDGTLKQALQASGNSLSSIVCFYGFLPNAISQGSNYYSVSLSTSFNVTGGKMNFVSGGALQNDITLNSVAGGIDKLFVIVDYDVSLIESIYSANIGNDVINDITNIDSDGQTYISYTSDFVFVVRGSEVSASV